MRCDQGRRRGGGIRNRAVAIHRLDRLGGSVEVQNGSGADEEIHRAAADDGRRTHLHGAFEDVDGASTGAGVGGIEGQGTQAALREATGRATRNRGIEIQDVGRAIDAEDQGTGAAGGDTQAAADGGRTAGLQNPAVEPDATGVHREGLAWSQRQVERGQFQGRRGDGSLSGDRSSNQVMGIGRHRRRTRRCSGEAG